MAPILIMLQRGSVHGWYSLFTLRPPSGHFDPELVYDGKKQMSKEKLAFMLYEANVEASTSRLPVDRKARGTGRKFLAGRHIEYVYD